MDPQVVPAPARKFMKKHQMLMLFLALVALIAIGVGVYYYNQYTSLNNIIKNPNLAVTKQTQQLITQVGKLMELPKDEQPTVATVTDASKLKGQAFFANAVNGDKVLIYVKARKAILYDPVKNVIVDVAPVNISQNQTPAPSGTQVQTQTAVATPTSVPTSAPTATVAPTR